MDKKLRVSMQGLASWSLQLIRSNRFYTVTLAAGVFGAILFCALHIAHKVAGTRYDLSGIFLKMQLRGRDHSLSVDGSYSELFEYVVLAVIVLTLTRVALSCRQPIYVALGLVFTYCIVDNALQVHERLGGQLADYFSLTPALHLRAQDYGEIGVWVLFGIPLLTYLLIALHVSRDRHRLIGITLTRWFLVLAFFGGAVDMLHSAAGGRWMNDAILGFVEDGGEMVVIVIIGALTLAVPSYLRDEETESQLA